MKPTKKTTLVGVLLLAGALAGCGDFLTGPGLSTDPNRPSDADINQLYQGVQLAQFGFQTGDLARTTSMWVQQMSGTDRQYINRALYDIQEGDFDFYFTSIYTGGGLVDMRRIQELATEQNDRIYGGIAKVWEAYLMGTAASMWGDIPYSEAVGSNETPALDNQEDIYAAVQSVLDDAIADLQSGTGDGPGSLDLVYGGDASKWIEAAYTLKARFYMHWTEAQDAGMSEAQTACGGDCVANAMTAAANGIASSADDFNTYQTANPGEQNFWYQFMSVYRPGYISAGQYFVDMLKTRTDPRLTEYFAPTSSGDVEGAPQGVSTTASVLSSTRGAADFDQPLITYAENELILAEANQRAGNDPVAITHLNNERADAGLAAITPSAATLLQEIMMEKYTAMFQNIEAWNDYKRTCYPQITPAGGGTVPGRLIYGFSERDVNPNIPEPTAAPARNTNDPNGC